MKAERWDKGECEQWVMKAQSEGKEGIGGRMGEEEERNTLGWDE